MKKQLQEVHLIRAVASLAVMLTHFCTAEQLKLPIIFFPFGYLGVHLFFVLSGFIICYSLPINYEIKNFKTFLVKRILRIEPAYISSILLILVLNFISYKITKYQENTFVWSDFFYHLAYLNNFGLGKYYNTNYWTLGIEFQYYFIIGLVFPLISKNKWTLLIFIITLCILSCLSFNRGPTIEGGIQIILPFLSIFGTGILIFFHKHTNKMPFKWFISLSIILLIQIFYFFDFKTFLATSIAALILMFWNYENRVILFFSKISFSLYLIHFIVGMKVINLGLRFIHYDYQRYILYCIAVFVAVICAYLFYLLVENPSYRWAKKIHYSRS